MKIAAVDNSVQKKQPFSKVKSNQTPSFKSGNIGLFLADSLMGFIDKQGYLVSFLIQDGLGMTAPRVATGFFRDRKETGEFNLKEAKEVFLREALSGPYMMAVAPFMLFLFGKFCKSANTNTRLLKIIGNNMKSMIKAPKYDKAVQKDAAEFQQKFVRFNIEKFYNSTVPNDAENNKTISYIMSEFEKLTSKDKKARKEGLANITDKINDKILETSSNFDKLGTLNIEYEGKTKAFSIKDVINAIKDYSTDAIKNNKHSAEIDETAVNNITNNFATKRLLLTIANIFGTLGGLSIIPKIYARDKVAPGARHLLNKQDENDKPVENNETKEVTFKGKGINGNGVFARIGEFLTKKVPDWFQKEFEYSGINFTKSLMASLALFGLLVPRGKRALDRALVDENGKKDYSEFKEIMVRDTISSLGVVYIVPILTKCFVKGCEAIEGFVLTNRASSNKTWFKKFLDTVNPYSELEVFDSGKLQALYNNIDSKKKMLNLCEYIDKKGGDLGKILSKSNNAKLMFNSSTFTLDSIKNKTIAEKNKKITNLIKGMEEGKANELIKRVMQDTGAFKKSGITRFARGLYSIPGAITTVIISPIILGCLVPMITYSNTRKAHEKMSMGGNKNEQNKVVA